MSNTPIQTGIESSRVLWVHSVTAAFIFALLSKPAAVSVPLMAMVLGIGLLRRRPRVVLLEMLPWLIAAGCIALVTRRLQPGTDLNFTPSLAQRPLIALDTISFYVGKFGRAGRDYAQITKRTPQFVVSGRSFQIGWLLLPAAAVVGLMWACRGSAWRL